MKGLMYNIHYGDCATILPKLEKKYTTIYLDPPFNSGRNYVFSASEKQHGFEDVWTNESYEEWLNTIVYLCKNVLLTNGTLFFHISAELSYIPETILLKHFKHVNKIFWKKAHGKNTVKIKLGAVIDIIFMCSNSKTKFNLLYTPLNEKYFEQSYKLKDEVGLYGLGSIKHDKTRKGHMYAVNINNQIYKPPHGWKISKDKLDELLQLNKIHFGKKMLYKKLYKHECKGKPLSNLWDDISYITRSNKDKRIYPTQKPIPLLSRIIELSSCEEDWILDPVAGSGTTGVSALLNNRNVTLIDMNNDAITILTKRLQELDINNIIC